MDDDERDATRAAQEAVGDLADSVRLDPTDLLTRAMVAATLAPTWDFYPSMTMNTDGSQTSVMVPVKRGSPMADIGAALWADRRDEVLAAVVARIDPAALVETIVARIINDLTRQRDRYFSTRDLHPEAEAVQKLVREQLASTLSARAMQAYDDEQAEMRTALAEKRARERAADAAVGNDPGPT